jgi:hypothetical protein
MAKISPLVHTEKATDEDLVGQELQFFNANPAVKIVAELIQANRAAKPKWWTPEKLRDAFSTTQRMTALVHRPDLRQQITTELVGTKPKMARRQSPEEQAADIDAVIESGDVSPEQFEDAYASGVLAVYMDPAAYWRLFRDQMPWDEDSEAHQALIADLITALLNEKILTAHDVLTGIDRFVWHDKIPQDVAVDIEIASLKREQEDSTRPFLAADKLAIATPKVITKYIKLTELKGIIDRAEIAMEFAPPPELIKSEAPPPEVSIDASTETEEAKPTTNGSSNGSDEKPTEESSSSDVLKLDDLGDSPKA